VAPVTGTTKEETMDQFQLAICIMAANDRHWGPRDAEGRRRAFTAEELDALASWGWHGPNLKGAIAACATAVRSLRWRRTCNSVASPRLSAPPSILGWRERREAQVSTVQRSRTAISIFAAVLTFALCAPVAVNAEDEVIAAEEPLLAAVPAAPSWDETSGYGAVEASRAGASALLAAGTAPSWDDTSGYGSVEASRAAVSALSDEVIPDQEQALAFAAAAATLWDATSGYGSVEASRAANALAALPVLIKSQVSSDVRWAPEQALEHAMNPLVAVAIAWDETSGYGAVEASRAQR
jgi:hypothetical protein